MTKSSPIVEIDHVSKSFYLWKERPNNLKSYLVLAMKGELFKREVEEIPVLSDVSFQIYPGEFVGIMGRNGVGKSTLMRLITGIYEPTSGTIDTRGKVAPLISLGAGFNPELSGYENIFLNASILGLGRSKTLERLDTIISFSGLEKKIHMPIKNYSSGMVVRLGFSIATHIDADILLLDEVLGVGDAGFKAKSMEKIFELHKQGKTIILVSHSPGLVAEHCSRCVLLNNGVKIFDGEAQDGAKKYEALF